MANTKIFFHQTLVAMADTFKRATKQDEIAEDMKAFAKVFFEKFRAAQLKENGA